MWVVHPFHGVAAPIEFRRDHLRVIPQNWIQEARDKAYDFQGITSEFQGPCLLEPVVSVSRFGLPYDPPETSDIRSWWGEHLFFFMATRLQQMLSQRRRKGLGELWHFQASMAEWKAGVVYGCGGKETQLLPRDAIRNLRGEVLGRQQWWPVLYIEHNECVVAWCQAQCLTW